MFLSIPVTSFIVSCNVLSCGLQGGWYTRNCVPYFSMWTTLLCNFYPFSLSSFYYLYHWLTSVKQNYSVLCSCASVLAVQYVSGPYLRGVGLFLIHIIALLPAAHPSRPFDHYCNCTNCCRRLPFWGGESRSVTTWVCGEGKQGPI